MKKKRILVLATVAVLALLLAVGCFRFYSAHHRSSGKRLEAETVKTFCETHQDALEALPGQLRGAYRQFDLERKGDKLVCSWQTADGTEATNVPLTEAELPADAIDCLQTLMELPALRVTYLVNELEVLNVLVYESYSTPMFSACTAATWIGLSYAPNEHHHRSATLLGGSWYLYEDFMP